MDDVVHHDGDRSTATRMPSTSSSGKYPVTVELQTRSPSPSTSGEVPLHTNTWNRWMLSKYPGTGRIVMKIANWIRGPQPPQPMSPPTPFLHITLTVPPHQKTRSLALEPVLIHYTRRLGSIYLFALLAVAYIIGMAFFVKAQYYFTPPDAFIDCTSTYWLANNQCGLDGNLCEPFVDSSPFEFRCPAGCLSTTLANIRAVGAEEPRFVPLVVGGGDVNKTYRGDSFICAAATHAGLISNSRGGCAAVTLIGNYTNFIASAAHAVTSIGFPSIFPLSYRFTPPITLSHCADLRNEALVLNVFVTAILFLVLRPRPIILFWSLVCIGFWHITFFSDARGNPPPISDAWGTFLPTLITGYMIWRCSYQHVLPAFEKAPIERAVWYLVSYWLGVLLNVVFAKVPIDRLTPSDIKAQPGGIIAVVILSVALLIIALNQIRVIRKTGWLPTYLSWYIVGGLALLVLSQLPTLNLRLHHYFIALLLLPGTSFPTRLSAIYQGLLLGMFLNGVARWDFQSILQTAAELQRDAPLGSSLPALLTNSTLPPLAVPNGTLSWPPIPTDLAASEGWNGFSLIVDDVERYSGTALNYSFAALQEGIVHFFRLAFQNNGSSGDYTQAATFWSNGTFVDPSPGPS